MCSVLVEENNDALTKFSTASLCSRYLTFVFSRNQILKCTYVLRLVFANSGKSLCPSRRLMFLQRKPVEEASIFRLVQLSAYYVH